MNLCGSLREERNSVPTQASKARAWEARPTNTAEIPQTIGVLIMTNKVSELIFLVIIRCFEEKESLLSWLPERR